MAIRMTCRSEAHPYTPNITCSPTRQSRPCYPPPLAYEGERQKIIEIRTQLVYSVYAGGNYCFRVGLDFIKFKNDGLRILKDKLDNQILLSSTGVKPA